MLSLLSGLKAKVIGAILAIGTGLALALRLLARGKRTGRQEVIHETRERALHHATMRHRVEDRIGGADGAELDRLRDKWTRPERRMPVDRDDLDPPR